MRQFFPRHLFLFLTFICLTISAFSQPLKINVSVAPPYPRQAAAYLLNPTGPTVIVTVVNTSRAPVDYRLIPTLRNNTEGFTVGYNPGFSPSSFLSIPGNETRVLTFSQLKAHWGAAGMGNLVATGKPLAEIMNNDLPAGSYQFCLLAYDNAGGVVSSSVGNCGIFQIQDILYDAPTILQPANNAFIQPPQQQFLMFNWTTVGQPMGTRYRFELVDMTAYKLTNPEDAFKSPAIQKYYTTDNLMAPNLPYNMSLPPLQAGHRYAVRVQAYSLPDFNLKFKNNGYSQAISFTWGEKVVPQSPGAIQQPKPKASEEGLQVVLKLDIKDIAPIPPPPADPVPDPNDGPGCKNSCVVQAPAGPAVNVTQGQEVVVGKFKMVITNISGPNTGEGTIHIPYLKTTVKVKFSGIGVNAQGQLFSGKVTGKVDALNVIDQALADSDNPNLQGLSAKLSDINQLISDNARRVSMKTGSEPPIGLPIGIDNSAFNMAVVGLIFTPTEAFLHTVVGIPVPESISGELLNFNRAKIGIRPNGYCQNVDMKITLAQDQNINADQSGTVLRIKGGNNGSFIDFDCSGVKGIQVKGELEFPESKLKKVEAGKVVPGKVKATFETYATDFNDWIIENATMVPATFTTPSTQGFIFTASNIIMDHSTKKNPVNFKIHDSHPQKGQNTWTGLFIKNIGIQFPEGFFKQDNTPLKIDFTDVVLDKTGFWGLFNANNVLNNGSIGGWKFSISQFGLDVRASQLSGGSLAGGIELPISDKSLNFNCAISAANDGANFDFAISPGPVDMNLWLATLQLDGNSTIGIQKTGGKFLPKATLSGMLAIGWSKGQQFQGNKPSVGNFSLPDFEFHNLVIETNPNNYMPSIKSIQLPLDNVVQQVQGAMAGFPISLKSLGVNIQGGAFGLSMELGLRLDQQDNGIGGSGAFTINGKLNNNKKFVFDNIKFDGLTVDADIGFASLKGGIQIFQDDPVYQDGFLGWMDANIKAINMGLSMVLQAGKKEDYRYWMFDACLKLPNPGLVISPGFSLYGFGGGAYMNMSRQPKYAERDITQVSNVNPNNFEEKPGQLPSGDTYVPQKGHWGFKAQIIFGLSGAEQAFSGDVTFGIDLGDKMNVKKVYFDGKAYLMAPMTNRENAAIKGTAYVEIVPKQEGDPNTPSFLADINVEVNVASIVKITAPISMYFSPTDWYVYFGSWDQTIPEHSYEPSEDPKRIQLNIDVPVINVQVNFNAYFMMGTTLPSNLPPLPKKVREFFSDAPKPSMMTQTSAQNGLGFALGAGVKLEANLEFFILYADIDFMMGFDGLIKQFINPECGNKTNIGINNWYALGQAYAYLHVDGGLMLNLWVWKGKVSILKFTTGALLQLQGPNPMWMAGNFKFEGEVLGGLIKVSTKFYAEVGEKCTMGTGTPFDDIPIISYTDPGKGDEDIHPYTDPQIAFNFPRGMFSIDGIDDKGNPITKWYSYGITQHKYTYKEKNSNETKNLAFKGGPLYGPDNYSCKYIPDPYLPGEASVTFDIKTVGYEHPNGLINNKVQAGSIQTHTGTFKTGKLPDEILINDIITAVPERNQRYFLKGSFPQGSVRMSKGQCSHLFRSFNPEYPAEKYIYKARFTNLKTKNVIEVDCSCSGQKVNFSIPQNLNVSSIYSLEIVRRSAPEDGGGQESVSIAGYKTIGGGNQQNVPVPPNLQVNQLKLPPVNPNQGFNKLMAPPANNAVPLVPQNLNIQAQPQQKTQNVSIQMYDRKLAGQIVSVKENEKVLLTYHFRTSMYNTKDDKLKAMLTIDPPNPITQTYEIDPFQVEFQYYDFMAINSVEVPIYLAEVKENFDQYDTYGTFFGDQFDVQQGKHTIIPPIFQFKQPGNNFDWVGRTFYSISPSEYGGIYETPDQQDYIYKWSIKDLSMETVQYADRTQIIWPQWHFEYYPPYDHQIWSETRFGETFPYPFGRYKWFGIKRKFPELGMTGDFAYVTFYDWTQHGHTNLKGYNVKKPDGMLTNFEILQAKNSGGALNMQVAPPAQKMYVGFIDFTEWCTKRDFSRFMNYVLNRTKSKVDVYKGETDPYYAFGYLPIRNYMMFLRYYQSRPPGNFDFRMENTNFTYQSPHLNKDWPFKY